MASLDPQIVVVYSEYRPCTVDGIGNALFHRWENYSKPIPAGLTIGSYPAGVVSYTVGIVEDITGPVHRVPPSDIKFTDRKICNYVFEEVSEE